MPNSDAESRRALDARMAGLAAFSSQRKHNSRESLLEAATRLFCRDGYASVGIEDITKEAKVSRVTFYRHFPTKSAVVQEIFQRAATKGVPHILAIGERAYRDRAVVIGWLYEVFASDRDMQGILRVLSQANLAEADFTKAAQPFIFEILAMLATRIPAFAVEEMPYRRAKAWMLLYTILDQSNRTAMAGLTPDPMIIEVLADSFIDFVGEGDAAE